MLERIGISFDVLPAHTDETPREGEPPLACVGRVALEKAVAARVPDAFILAADTAVLVDNAILGKPCDNAEARAMLSLLSGRTHTVATAYVVLAPTSDAPAATRTVMSDVTFRALTADEIAAYVETGEARGKAGAYAIQGCAAAFVEQVSGSYTNIVGLPLAEVVEDLAACGAIDWPKCLARKGRAS
jgi:septum formation protein